MKESKDNVFQRYTQYTQGNFEETSLPKYKRYAISNFRGGVGKTSLSFNLGYELSKKAEKILFADLCPQTNLSEVILQDQTSIGVDVYSALLSEVMPGSINGIAGSVAMSIGPTCASFSGKKAFLLKGAMDLYLFPGILYTQLNTAAALMRTQAQSAIQNTLLSLDRIVEREEKEWKFTKVLIDTSPFFAGATHLAWMAADALIVPVRVDHASVSGLNLLLKMLHDPSLEFVRYTRLAGLERLPKIHSILITHANWSRRKPYEPDAATRNFVGNAVNLAMQYPGAFDTDNPADHVFLLDDFLSAGKVSGEKGIPIGELRPGQQFSIHNNKFYVNDSVQRYQKQLEYISGLL